MWNFTKEIGGGGGCGRVRGCQGGCERRSEVIVKIKKKIRGGGPVGGIRVDVNGAGIGFEGSGRM